MVLQSVIVAKINYLCIWIEATLSKTFWIIKEALCLLLV